MIFDTLDNVPAELGLDLTLLIEKREELVQAFLAGSPNRFELASGYRELAEIAAEATPRDVTTYAKIAVIVHMALILRDGGDINRYRVELGDAADYAQGEGLFALVDLIEDELR